MLSLLKNKLHLIIICFFALICFVAPIGNLAEASAPQYEKDFTTSLTKNNWVLEKSRFGIDPDKTLRENISEMFYPRTEKGESKIYELIR